MQPWQSYRSISVHQVSTLTPQLTQCFRSDRHTERQLVIIAMNKVIGGWEDGQRRAGRHGWEGGETDLLRRTGIPEGEWKTESQKGLRLRTGMANAGTLKPEQRTPRSQPKGQGG